MRKKLFIKTTIALATLIALSACTTNRIASVVTDDNYKVLCNPLKLKKGEVLQVELPSSRFSGYKWEVENGASTILQLLSTKTEKESSSIEDGIHRQSTILQFKGYEPGSAKLSFIYRLAWDTNVPDTQRIVCPVTVSN